ncbi:MAG: hypothetical protein MJY98_03575 [Fibrobacter sp.]|nr:hypothetical protein [Fibrobacter sp.]
MIKIPIETGGGSYMVERVNIEGVMLSIRLLWNWRDGNWFADFETVNGKRCGIRLVPNSRLLKSRNEVLENGDLAIFKREKTCKELLNHDNLGKAYVLHYLTKADVAVFEKAGML